jgi:hypothetical protein
MDIKNINHLVSIRDYIYVTINNPAFTRDTVVELQEILSALDRKIVESLKSPEFKEIIGFVSKKKIVDNTIKSSLK